MDKAETGNMDVDLKEVYGFSEALKEMGIPVVIEYRQSIPSRLYYRPGECGWTGIAILKGNEVIDNERYCGLVLGETADVLMDTHENVMTVPSGKFDFAMYVAKIRGHVWGNLHISDLDIYIQNAIKESKFIHEIGYMRESSKKSNINANHAFDLSEDIALKDYQMKIYLKRKINAEADIHVMTKDSAY